MARYIDADKLFMKRDDLPGKLDSSDECEGELVAKKRCGECMRYDECKPYVSSEETFPEVEGGCSAFVEKNTCDRDAFIVREFAKWLISRPGNVIYCGDLPDLVLEYIEGGME